MCAFPKWLSAGFFFMSASLWERYAVVFQQSCDQIMATRYSLSQKHPSVSPQRSLSTNWNPSLWALMCDSHPSLTFIDQNSGSPFFSTPHVHMGIGKYLQTPGVQHNPPTPHLLFTSYLLQLDCIPISDSIRPDQACWIGGQLLTKDAVPHTSHAAVTKWTL